MGANGQRETSGRRGRPDHSELERVILAERKQTDENAIPGRGAQTELGLALLLDVSFGGDSGTQ